MQAPPRARGAEAAAPAARSAWPPHVAGDVLAMLWGQAAWMTGVFLAIAAAGVVLAIRAPTVYLAHSSLLIRLGQPYVYQPEIGDAARGAAQDTDQVVQSELEILQSDAVKIRTIKDIGLGRLFPELRRAYAGAGPEQQAQLEQSAMRRLSSSLKVVAAPGSSIARLTYADKTADRAALVLNTLVDEYLSYRKTVLAQNLAPLGQQRQAFQSRLDEAEAAYQSFLSKNGIGDFDAEKASLAQIYGQLLTDSYSAGAQSAEVQGRLGATAQEMAAAQPEIGLYRDLDHAAQDRLLQLKVDLQDLLSRYQSSAQPVREVQEKIAAEQALIASGQASGGGARRMGVNPVYQTLQTEKNQLQAQSASLRDRKARLAAELAEVSARRRRLAALEPEFQALARQRDLLAADVKTLAQREQESQAAQGLAQSGEDGSIRIVERAYPPARGSSIRGPFLLVALVFAAFAAVCVGLLRGLLHPGFPSARAAERALDMPILAAVPTK